MLQKIKNFIVIGIAGLAMTAPGLMLPVLSGVANADIKGNLCTGANQAANDGVGGNGCGSGGTGDPSAGLGPLAAKVVKFFSIIVGAIAIIMIIYGGFRYITSGGDSNRVGSAKNTLIYAIIGLIIVALAQIIVHFVINTASDTGSKFQ